MVELYIWEKFQFENAPVGVKFHLLRPEGMKQLEKALPLCELVKEAQLRKEPFYMAKENEDCAGKVVLGMEENPCFARGGQLGIRYGIYQDTRANARVHEYTYRFPRGTVNYVAFSTLEKLDFDPDLLIVSATPGQAEIVMRAMSYSTGEVWSSRLASVEGCSWLFAYPYLSGKVNYMITGMTFGMKAREVFPEGLVMISIPWDWIPVITNNLKEMEWVLPAYTDGREQFQKRQQDINEELIRLSENP
jgi:uncharacterized protein (DUF169 family)